MYIYILVNYWSIHCSRWFAHFWLWF